MGSCKGLNWLSYFDPHKDSKAVWGRSGDLTDSRMLCPCCGRGTPRMKCPLKGRLVIRGICYEDVYININRSNYVANLEQIVHYQQYQL